MSELSSHVNYKRIREAKQGAEDVVDRRTFDQ